MTRVTTHELAKKRTFSRVILRAKFLTHESINGLSRRGSHESDSTIHYRGRTKRISPFAGHCIDSTPVVRSFILQLLLRDDPDTRSEYLNRFLEGERRFMRDAKQGLHSKEL